MDTSKLSFKAGLIGSAVESLFDETFVRATVLVAEQLDSDSKAALWMKTGNPMLGGLTPIELFLIGRGDRVLKFIENLVAETDA